MNCVTYFLPCLTCSVPENKQLGEWAGLCKLDSEGTARKVVGCSCAVITGGWATRAEVWALGVGWFQHGAHQHLRGLLC